MNITQIENKLKDLVANINKDTFIYDLLLAYNLPKSSVTRLQTGSLNLSKTAGEVSWKKKLFYKELHGADLHLAITQAVKDIKHHQRFVVLTDFTNLVAADTLTGDKLNIQLTDLPKNYDFFLPWAGMEKAKHAEENPADVKAATKMAKLFDEIKKDNPNKDKAFLHTLNIFFSRVLFCYFAEDTDIFKDNQFSKAVESHTKADGTDTAEYLNRLFTVLNTPKNQRGDIPNYLNDFPYVNGGLFRDHVDAPIFSSKSRQLLIDSGAENDWSAINPDIFGSMFQAVIDPEHRGGLGAHYTSVPNIMKVIEPLFLNELYEEFEKATHNPKKLNELLHRISQIKIFDPACGSGNFLIIAYKELRKLEIAIIKQLADLKKAASGFEPQQLELIPKSQLSLAASYQVELFSRIQLTQFYGIEIDDFAHEIAQLSLWLAEHQMNQAFKNEFGQANPTLPLNQAANITHGNACRVNWEEVCPKQDGDEIYILGNPPYLGSRKQKAEHKSDMTSVFSEFPNYKDLDYILCWFYLGSKFINGIKAKLAFVSTNSICQGLQVDMFWPQIFKSNIEIDFAYSSFKWSNNAKDKATVTVIILGLRNLSLGLKANLFSNNRVLVVDELNGYLIAGKKSLTIQKSTKSISKLPKINHGNMPADGGHLLFDTTEKEALLKLNNDLSKFFKPILSAREYLNGRDRWCLWLENWKLKDLFEVEVLADIIEKVRVVRLNSSRPQLAEYPHLFAQITQPNSGYCIIVPRVSSERRTHLPIGLIDGSIFKVTDSLFFVNTERVYIFSLVSSRIHTLWLKAIGGKMKTDFQYSKNIVYNTFPFPSISKQREEELTQSTFRILEEREKHSEKTLAQLYDPDKMPEGLREAHRLNDEAVERCYRSTPFTSDEERLEYLFKLYEKMIAEEKEKNTLFAKDKKKRKTKAK